MERDEIKAKAIEELQSLVDDYKVAKEVGGGHEKLAAYALMGAVELYEAMFEGEEVHWHSGKVTIDKKEEAE